MTKKRVVITGIGMLTPIGTTNEFWKNCLSHVSGISKFKQLEAHTFETKLCGKVNFNLFHQYMPPTVLRRTDRFVHLGLTATHMALKDARLDTTSTHPDSIGVCIGSGLGGIPFHEEQILAACNKGFRRMYPLTIPKVSPNSVSTHISVMYGLKGPNLTISTACASSSHAIGQAYKLIQQGETRLMITGGAEAPLTPFTFAAYEALQLLSSHQNDPADAVKPFDRERDGFVLSEGAAILILEELTNAIAREAYIYAEVKGYACNSSAFNPITPQPDGGDGAAVIAAALEDAETLPHAIDYINAHGTATSSNDLAETNAIKAAFGPHAYNIPVSSIKGLIGHTVGAAGAIDAATSILAITHNTIPPTANCKNNDPLCDLDYVPGTPRFARLNTVMSNSFGMGGNNSSLIFVRYNNGIPHNIEYDWPKNCPKN
jgi:3-oxoacyl-[acyl-carrier-protein] synthase II